MILDKDYYYQAKISLFQTEIRNFILGCKGGKYNDQKSLISAQVSNNYYCYYYVAV